MQDNQRLTGINLLNELVWMGGWIETTKDGEVSKVT